MSVTAKTVIEPADILPWETYAAQRREWRTRMTAVKRPRRIAVGPHITFFFENWQTMWHQVQEMLHIEKGGAAQLPDELAAYNPLVPNGRELTATFMIEIDDPERRKRVLGALGGIEETAFLEIGGRRVNAVAETDQDRTTADGKASSVQFVHFPLDDAAMAGLREKGARILLGLDHPHYAHMTVLPEATRAALAGDLI
jgi:hypothetical protein